MSASDDGDAGDAGTTREGATARDARQAWISFGDDDATDATVDARAGRGDARETDVRAEDVDELARARAVGGGGDERAAGDERARRRAKTARGGARANARVDLSRGGVRDDRDEREG